MRIKMAAASILGGFILAPGFAAHAAKADYQRSVTEWRAQRESQLKAEDGWLTVVGLTWLKEGDNRVGSNPNFEVRLPKTAPENVGTLTVKAGKVRFRPEGVAVTMNGAPAKETELKPDVDASYDKLAVGRVKFFIIKREDKLGVRIKDKDSAARREFTGLKWYPVDPSWRVQAKFVPWDKPHVVTFDTAVGVKEKDESPGYLSFQRGGKEYRLEPVVDDNDLWFVMRDQTSGKTTYGASPVSICGDAERRGEEERDGRDRLQQSGESAVRVHGFRDVPAASAAESAAYRCDCRGKTVRENALTGRI